jgi:F0F1-type ATP synthase membrane subunit b/b'
LTLEEKIEHLQAVSMEEARAEGNAIIDNYRAALEKVLEDIKDKESNYLN